ncbi:interferon alpha-inducible protein 27-like protein 2 [Agelaius phoeniceus]|uniref:interferon alpha-inducible protein 27-like protein 2 n=1 Tax=Agelaius phoeniceus TaxID=39638 RepID=UPI004055287E
MGDFAKASKRKPTPEEEPKEETLLDEKSGEHTTPGDEPKKETISDEVSGEDTTTGDEPKEETISDEESKDETNPGDKPKNEARRSKKKGKNGSIIRTVIGATVGAGLAVVGVPVLIGALGFTGAGIAAGSVAAKMMSAAAIANGGGVAAGSTVAVLQSIGAAGLSLGAKVGLGSVGAATGAWFSKGKKPPSDNPK